MPIKKAAQASFPYQYIGRKRKTKGVTVAKGASVLKNIEKFQNKTNKRKPRIAKRRKPIRATKKKLIALMNEQSLKLNRKNNSNTDHQTQEISGMPKRKDFYINQADASGKCKKVKKDDKETKKQEEVEKTKTENQEKAQGTTKEMKTERSVEFCSHKNPRSKARCHACNQVDQKYSQKYIPRQTNKVCFGCREEGHLLSECPKFKSSEKVAVCYFCGSTEHMSKKCKNKNKETAPFATCFICHEMGHMSSTCPSNSRGIYVNGGSCNLCGSIRHLYSNCPERKSKNKGKIEDEPEPVLDEQSNVKSADSIEPEKKIDDKKSKKPAVVVF